VGIKESYLSHFYMLRSSFFIVMILTSLEVCYIIIHNDVRVIGLLQVKVRVVQCVLISVNLCRKTCKSIRWCVWDGSYDCINISAFWLS